MKLDKFGTSEASSTSSLSRLVNLHAFHTHIETKLPVSLISSLYTSGCQLHHQSLVLLTTLLKERVCQSQAKTGGTGIRELMYMEKIETI